MFSNLQDYLVYGTDNTINLRNMKQIQLVYIPLCTVNLNTCTKKKTKWKAKNTREIYKKHDD